MSINGVIDPYKDLGPTKPTDMISIQGATVPTAVPLPIIKPYSPGRPDYRPGVSDAYTASPNYSLDYNDPKTINSWADIISTTFTPWTMNRPNLGNFNFLNDIPLINILPATVDLFNRSIVQPVVHGQPLTAVTNYLQNLGETGDILNNPTKAILQGKGLDGFIDAMGWGSNGRVNHDWNTGNLGTDILAETLSDPLTYITLGIGGAAKVGASGAAAGLKSVAKAGMEASDEALKVVGQRAIRSYLEGESKTILEGAQKASKGLSETGRFLSGGSRDLLKTEFANIAESLKGVTQQVDADILTRSLHAIATPVNQFSDKMFKAVLWQGPVYPAYAILKDGIIDPIREMHINRYMSALEPYLLQDGTLDTFKHIDAETSATDVLKQMNTAARITDSYSISPNVFTVQVQDSIHTQFRTINEIIDKNMAKPERLNEDLCKYLGHEDPDILHRYLEQLQGINQRTNDAFINEENDLVDKINTVAIAKTAAEDTEHLKDINTAEDMIRSTVDKHVFLFEKGIKQELDPILDSANIEARTKLNTMSSVEYDTQLKELLSERTNIRSRIDEIDDLLQNKNADKTTYQELLDEDKRLRNILAGAKPDYNNKATLNEQIKKYNTYMDQFNRNNEYLKYYKDLTTRAADPGTLAEKTRLEQQLVASQETEKYYNLAHSTPIDTEANFIARRNQIVELFKQVRASMDTISGNEIPEDLLRHVQEPMQISSKYINELETRALSALESRYKTGASIAMNYKLNSPVQKLLQYRDQSINLFDHIRTGIQAPEGNTNSKIIDGSLGFSNLQGKIIDKLTETQSRVAGFKPKEIQYIFNQKDQKKIFDIKQEFITYFAKNKSLQPGIFADWLETNQSRGLAQNGIKGHPQVFEELMQAFIASDPLEKPNEFVVNQNALINFMHSMLSNITGEARGAAKVNEFTDLQDLVTQLENINTTKVQAAQLKVLSSGMIYKLKLEQAYSLSMMVDNEEMQQANAILQSMITKQGAGAFLANYAQMGALIGSDDYPLVSACNDLMSKAQSHVNLMDFRSALNKDPVLTDSVKATFWDVIQNYARMPANEVYSNLDYHLNKDDGIYNLVENYINAKTQTRGRDLDLLAKQYNVEIPKELRHTSAGDTVLLREVVNAAKLDIPDNAIMADIETTSLYKEQGSILEISLQVPGQQPVTFKRALSDLQPSDRPSDSLLATFYPDVPVEQRMAMFQARYAGADKSEAELLQQVEDWLKEQDVTAPIVFHNEKFDAGYIQYRANINGVTTFNQLDGRTIDSLKLFKEKDGVFMLGKPEKNELRRLLQNYALKQVQNSDADQFINPHVGDIADLFKTIQKELGSKIASQGNYDMKQQLIILRDAMNDTANHLYETMRSISQQNDELGHIFLDGTRFNKSDMFDSTIHSYVADLKSFIQEHKPELLQTTGLTEEQLDHFTDYMNSSKFMYGLLGDKVAPIAYKRAIDFTGIQEWFNFKTGDTMNNSLALGLTSLAKRFESSVRAIKNPAPLNAIADRVEATIKLYQNFLNTDVASDFVFNTRLSFLKNIRSDKTNVLQNWAIVQYLHDQLSRDPHIATMLAEQTDPAVLDLLNDKQGRLFQKIIDSDGNTYLTHLASSSFSQRIADPVSYRQIADEFKRNFVDNLGSNLDVHGVTSAKRQVLSNNLMPIQDMLDAGADVMSDPALGYKDKLKIVSQVSDCTDYLAKQELHQILSLTPEELQAHMIHNAPWFEFDLREVAADQQLNEVLKNVLQNDKEYHAQGIQFIVDDDRMYAVFTKQKMVTHLYDEDAELTRFYLDGQEISAPVLKNLDYSGAVKNIDSPKLQTAISNARKSIMYLSEGKAAGSLGESLTSELVQHLYEQLPPQVQKLVSIDEFLDSDVWNTAKYNYINLGSIASKRLKEPKLPVSLPEIIKNNAQLIAVKAKTELQYLNLYFDPMFSINNGILGNNKTDAEIIKALQDNPQFALSALVKNPKSVKGYSVLHIRPMNVKQLNEARRLNAVVLPCQTFTEAYRLGNLGLFNDKKLQFWNKIIYATKFGQLWDIGFLIRNAIDNNLKAMIDTKSTVETLMMKPEAAKLLKQYDLTIEKIINMSQYDMQKLTDLGFDTNLIDLTLNLKKVHNKQQAFELFNKYNICADEIIKMNPNRQLLQSNIDFYFDHMEHELTKEAYNFVDTFIKSGYANGYTKVMSDYFLEHNIKPSDAKGLWNSFVHYSTKAMRPMNVLEQVDRMAEYMMFKERGLDSTTAFYNVAKTFFAFGERPYSAYLAGSIFPYYTFTLRNLDYWQKALEKNPLLFNYFSDIMTPVWNFDDLDNDELNANRSLQARIIAGDIPLTSAGLTLKTNPSFMDPISALINPIQFVTSKLYSPLQSVLTSAVSSSQLPYPFKSLFNASKTEYTYTLTDNGYIIWKNGNPMYTQNNYHAIHGLTVEQYAQQRVEKLKANAVKLRTGNTDSNEYNQNTSALGDFGQFLLEQLPIVGSIYQRYFVASQTNSSRLSQQGGTEAEQLLSQILPGTFGATKQYADSVYTPYQQKHYTPYQKQTYTHGYYPYSRNPKKTYARKVYARKTYARKTYNPYQHETMNRFQKFVPHKYLYTYPREIKNRIIQPMKNEIKYTDYRKFFYRSFYSSNYNKAGISHVSSMQQPTTIKNLQYRIRDDRYAFYHH